jgi:hypothetical protein
MRTSSPSGLAAPKSKRASLGPSTATALPRRGSPLGQNEPWRAPNFQSVGRSGVAPSTETLRARPPASTRARPIVTGTIVSMPGIRASASASSSVSLRWLPPRTPGMPSVFDLPGLTAMMLVPNCVNCDST